MEKNMSDAEAQIMKQIWKAGGRMTSGELIEKLTSLGAGWKRSTVSTFISRLCEKGLLNSAKRGRTYEYTALISQREYRAEVAGEFVEKLFGGSTKGLISTLVEEKRLSKEDIAELRKYLESEENDEQS